MTKAPSKIVSGGQTGADRAALDWAIKRGIPHGGWCPKGRKSEDGPIDVRYQLNETPRADYVVATLTAAVWCVLTSKNYRETVLKAVNLGGDTDTTGIVAGGLAGIHGGLGAVPEDWRNAMARAEDLASLFERFAASCPY
jgi:ADP-ribosylglycohydrolase